MTPTLWPSFRNHIWSFLPHSHDWKQISEFIPHSIRGKQAPPFKGNKPPWRYSSTQNILGIVIELCLPQVSGNATTVTIQTTTILIICQILFNELCMYCVCVLSCVWLFTTPWTVAYQAPLSMGFPRQGLPFPPPGDLPNAGIEPTFPESPALQADSLPI